MLYAFFIQWKPEAYGSEDENRDTAGFVDVKDRSDGDAEIDSSLSYLSDSQHLSNQLGRQLSMDWEVTVH